MPKIYGLWTKTDWMRRIDGQVVHSTYPQAVAAENRPHYHAEVREILLDGTPGETPIVIDDASEASAKSVRPQSDKMIRPRENK